MAKAKNETLLEVEEGNKLDFITLFYNNNLIYQVLPYLLRDQTTSKNIVWATDTYSQFGAYYHANQQMLPDFNINLILDGYLLPRVQKSKDVQASRTKLKAEVFTPSWLCNYMNNYCDTEWFGKEGVFNTEVEHAWIVNINPIKFAKARDWHKYIDSTRIEITCGEAPYLVSRYDTVTGKMIPIKERIGMLDRKIRVINENTHTEAQWLRWVIRAYQAIYGFEYQGDNLFFARVNLVQSFIEYYEDRFNKKPHIRTVRNIAQIVSWNLWQMDGLKYTEPYGIPQDEFTQMNLLDKEKEKSADEPVYSLIKDWKTGETMEFRKIKGDNKDEV